jgi:hypothetical protein
MKVIRSEDFYAWLRGYIKAFEEYSPTNIRSKVAEHLKYIERRSKDFEMEVKEK